jgi:hypothetical protein
MMQQGYYAVKGLAIGLEKNQDLLKPGVKASAESILGIGGMAKGMGTTTSTQNNNNTTTQIIVNNPVAQTAEESLAREMQKLAYTGVAG